MTLQRGFANVRIYACGCNVFKRRGDGSGLMRHERRSLNAEAVLVKQERGWGVWTRRPSRSQPAVRWRDLLALK